MSASAEPEGSGDEQAVVDAGLRAAVEAFSQRNLAAADILAHFILDHAPDDPVALNIVGAVAGALGLREAATRSLEAALRIEPRYAAARRNLERAQVLPPRPAQQASDRFLLIKAWGYGFWSDVNHVLGGLLLAEMTDRTPVVHWGSHSLFSDGPDGDAWRHYFEPVSAVSADNLIPLAAQVFPPKWNAENLLADGNAKWDGPGARMAGIYFLNRPESVAVSDFYLGVVDLLPWLEPDHPLHGAGVDEAYRYLVGRYLRPRSDIEAQVADFFERRLAGRPTIAVHLRGSDKKTEVDDLDALNTGYFDVLDQLDPDWAIFLLTDDERWLQRFRARYGDRIVATDSQRTADDRGPHYIDTMDRVALGREVLIDTLLAIRCDRFLGNGRSNISAMAVILKDWEAGTCTLLRSSMLHDRNPNIYMRATAGTR